MGSTTLGNNNKDIKLSIKFTSDEMATDVDCLLLIEDTKKPFYHPIKLSSIFSILRDMIKDTNCKVLGEIDELEYAAIKYYCK